jgi:chromosome segregation ATPase
MADQSAELALLTTSALKGTEQVKNLLKEIAMLSGKLRNLQGELEKERETRAALEARLSVFEERAAKGEVG